MTTTVAQATSTAPGELEALDDAGLLAIIQELPRDSELRDRAGEVLVTRYQPLVRGCVQRYRNSIESQDELMQVGYVGLLKAINNFDPAMGASLASYAQPCVSGEIKRHFRDKRWQIHVKRSLQELRLEIRAANAELISTLGRMPSTAEVAGHLGISEDDVNEARQAELAFHTASLDSPLASDDDSGSLADLVGADDPELEQIVDMQAVWTHWNDLPEREQELLLMRFYGNMTQSEIGHRLGISQMHVSRLLAEAISYLRERLHEPAAGDRAEATV